MDEAEGSGRGPRAPLQGASVVVAYALFIVVGLSAGINAPVLLAQMASYGVGQATIGLTFFTFSGGFVAAGATCGPLIHRFGTRTTLLLGGASFVVAGVVFATRPAFAVLVALQLLAGYGIGMVESVLNAYLAAPPAPPPCSTGCTRSSAWARCWVRSRRRRCCG